MNKIKADKGGQISFGDNSPNVQGVNNRFNFKKIDRKSFWGGFLTGVFSSLIASVIWSLIQKYFTMLFV